MKEKKQKRISQTNEKKILKTKLYSRSVIGRINTWALPL